MLIKRILAGAIIAGSCMLNTANAALPGVYLGAQAGWSSTHWDLTNVLGAVPVGTLPLNALATTGPLVSGKLDTTGIGARGFLGYQFNDYWAAELGYTRFNNTTIRDPRIIIPTTTGDVNILASDRTINEYAVDAVAKGILPLCNCFGLYGKLGAAYIGALGKGNINSNESRINPTFGLGLSYDVTPNVPIDVSWNRIQKIGGGNIPSTDLISFGVGYNFG